MPLALRDIDREFRLEQQPDLDGFSPPVISGLKPNLKDAALDEDRDGISNLLEYRYSANPKDPDSFPEFTLNIHTAVELDWPTVEGARYQIQSSDDLENWQNEGEPMSVDGQGLRQFFSTRDQARKFWRILVVE